MRLRLGFSPKVNDGSQVVVLNEAKDLLPVRRWYFRSVAGGLSAGAEVQSGATGGLSASAGAHWVPLAACPPVRDS